MGHSVERTTFEELTQMLLADYEINQPTNNFVRRLDSSSQRASHNVLSPSQMVIRVTCWSCAFSSRHCWSR